MSHSKPDMEEPTFSLIDDGTMDTVLMCDVCGEVLRFNPEPENPEEDFEEGGRVEIAFDMAFEDHECEGD